MPRTNLARATTAFVAATLSITMLTTAPPQPAAAAHPGENGKITYVRNSEIWVLDGESDLSPEYAYGRGADPAWSPGGTMLALAFRTTYGGRAEWDIALLSEDGEKVGLARGPSDDRSPAWSPDGSAVVFTSDRSGNSDLWVAYVSESGPFRTPTAYQVTTSPAADIDPAWSPDGSRIVYASNPTGQFDLFSVGVTREGCPGDHFCWTDGGRLWPTVPDSTDDVAPAWSPDGSTLAWTRGAGTGTDIMSMSPVASGSSVVELIASPAAEQAPAFSPDGQRLLFTRVSGDADVFVTGATDTTVQVNLTAASQGNDSAPDWQPIPDFPLVDARFSTFAADIEWLYEAGITGGCTSERFCPRGLVSRGQMAAFLDRALDFEPTTEDFFDDDSSSIFEDSINRLAAAGVAHGVGPRRFGPRYPVSRGEMAAFLVRALNLPATVEDYFVDDEDSIFEDDINRLAAAGIAAGIGDANYGPGLTVNRGEMAAFLHRALAP
jgi:Tol biopolymer transport system component